jgi:hypothetical protein
VESTSEVISHLNIVDKQSSLSLLFLSFEEETRKKLQLTRTGFLDIYQCITHIQANNTTHDITHYDTAHCVGHLSSSHHSPFEIRELLLVNHTTSQPIDSTWRHLNHHEKLSVTNITTLFDTSYQNPRFLISCRCHIACTLGTSTSGLGSLLRIWELDFGPPTHLRYSHLPV